MTTKEQMYVTTKGIEMYDSLIVAISNTGGYINKEDLLNMTVLDLISRLAVNGVRFTYERRND